QNRVSPLGELFAISARGTLMGNRGGKFHTEDKKLTSRRWVSRQWICCVLDFRNRHRDVWDRYYTELFFLDEVTAFAAGHRPCFECRRKNAEEFARLFSSKRQRASAPAMDKILHEERLDGKEKRTYKRKIDALPDGAMIVLGGGPYAVRRNRLFHWTPSGYAGAKRRPRDVSVDVLTPPSMLRVLKAGYLPLWHGSVDR
ncbi:MAG TPA: hypothetical protein VFX37_14140, partial [Pseudolabrys sp.]|nr:hypothetical protein [Pseudolabrys sp.]